MYRYNGIIEDQRHNGALRDFELGVQIFTTQIITH